MRKYSSDKDIHHLICQLVRENWMFRRCRKHGLVISPNGKRVFVSNTPSDTRAFQNFKKDIKR